MHFIQEQILSLLKKTDLNGSTLREIGDLIGEPDSPQKIKHHLLQLRDKGFINYSPEERELKLAPSVSMEGLISLPIYGSANCGPATMFADNRVEGHLRLSERLVPRGGKNLFVLRAKGDSMNRSRVGGNKSIEDGDFIIVDRSMTDPESGDYVVSLIDEAANIKKLEKDPDNQRVILHSESSSETLPIYIHEQDDYAIMGKVVDVVKR